MPPPYRADGGARRERMRLRSSGLTPARRPSSRSIDESRAEIARNSRNPVLVSRTMTERLSSGLSDRWTSPFWVILRSIWVTAGAVIPDRAANSVIGTPGSLEAKCRASRACATVIWASPARASTSAEIARAASRSAHSRPPSFTRSLSSLSTGAGPAPVAVAVSERVAPGSSRGLGGGVVFPFIVNTLMNPSDTRRAAMVMRG